MSAKIYPQHVVIKKILWQLFHYSMLVFASLLVITPLLLTFIASFKEPLEIFTGKKTDLPQHFSNFSNYASFIHEQPVAISFYNTIFVILISLLLLIIIGTMAAYVLSRFIFPGRSIILLLYVLVMAVPPITTQVSLYQVIQAIGLVNSKWALILLFSGADIVSLYIFIQYLQGVSKEIDESARIEGASYFQIYWRIILPLMTPAIATVIILRTIYIYNDFILPYLYTPTAEQSTVSMLLFKASDLLSANNQAVLMAGIIIVILPSILLFFLLQKRIISGVTRGAVKG